MSACDLIYVLEVSEYDEHNDVIGNPANSHQFRQCIPSIPTIDGRDSQSSRKCHLLQLFDIKSGVKCSNATIVSFNSFTLNMLLLPICILVQ